MSGLTAGQVLNGRWQLHRGTLLQLLDRLPESAAPFRAWPNGRTTLELVNHIGDHAEEMIGGALGDQPAPLPPATCLALARERLLRQSERLGGMLEASADEALARPVLIRRQHLRAPAGELIQLQIQHEAYHCGQLTYHARLLTIEPPYFVRNLWAFTNRLNRPEN